jgi:hypothetical protein
VDDSEFVAIRGNDRHFGGERFCPECGQALGNLRTSDKSGAREQRRWTYLLAILGAYLAIAFSGQAWANYQRLVDLDRILRGIPGCAMSQGINPACYSDITERESPVGFLRPYLTAKPRLERDVALAGLGTILVLAVLGVPTRRRWRQAVGREPPAQRAADRISARPWGLAPWEHLRTCAASLLLATVQALFVGVCYIVIATLLRGEPLSWGSGIQAVDRILTVGFGMS